MPVRETYRDWSKTYTDEERDVYGPYLMTYDNMNLEKETKMSVHVAGYDPGEKSRAQWAELMQRAQANAAKNARAAAKDAQQKAMAELTTQNHEQQSIKGHLTQSLQNSFGVKPETMARWVTRTGEWATLGDKAHTQEAQRYTQNFPYRGIGDNQAPQVASESERIAMNRVYNAEGRVKELEERLAMLGAANTQLHDALKIRTDERDALRQKTSAAEEEPGSHPYHGPSAPDASGRNVSIPDQVHERFHQSVGDILAGKVIPAARKQMEDALRQTPKDAPTTASTSKPMPGNATRFAVLEKGIRL